jgi:hypothetical protein
MEFAFCVKTRRVAFTREVGVGIQFALKNHKQIIGMIVVIERREDINGSSLKFFDSEIRLKVGRAVVRRWCPSGWPLRYKREYIRKHI